MNSDIIFRRLGTHFHLSLFARSLPRSFPETVILHLFALDAGKFAEPNFPRRFSAREQSSLYNFADLIWYGANERDYQRLNSIFICAVDLIYFTIGPLMYLCFYVGTYSTSFRIESGRNLGNLLQLGYNETRLILDTAMKYLIWASASVPGANSGPHLDFTAKL